MPENSGLADGMFPGGKSGRCVRLTTLPPSCAVVTKSENLNFMEPSGPLQACNGTAIKLQLINVIFTAVLIFIIFSSYLTLILLTWRIG